MKLLLPYFFLLAFLTANAQNCPPDFEQRTVNENGRYFLTCIPRNYYCRDCWRIIFPPCPGYKSEGTTLTDTYEKAYQIAEQAKAAALRSPNYSCVGSDKRTYRIYLKAPSSTNAITSSQTGSSTSTTPPAIPPSDKNIQLGGLYYSNSQVTQNTATPGNTDETSLKQEYQRQADSYLAKSQNPNQSSISQQLYVDLAKTNAMLAGNQQQVQQLDKQRANSQTTDILGGLLDGFMATGLTPTSAESNLAEQQLLAHQQAADELKEQSKTVFEQLLARERKPDAATLPGALVNLSLEHYAASSPLLAIINRGKLYHDRVTNTFGAAQDAYAGDLSQSSLNTFTSATQNPVIREVQRYMGGIAIDAKDMTTDFAGRIYDEDFSDADFEQYTREMNPLSRVRVDVTQAKPWTMREAATLALGGAVLATTAPLWIGISAAAWYGFTR